MFLVDDVDKAVQWYRDILGAQLQHSLPDTPPFEWVSLKLDGVEIMFARKESGRKWYTDRVETSIKPTNIIAYIYVNDINSMYEQLKDKAQVIMKPVDQDYGIREFAFQDPFGFVIVVAQITE